MVNRLMGFRVILLAAAGLAALYMIHLLALDYNKIRQPINKVRSFLRLRRELPDYSNWKNVNPADSFDINWRRILKYDPLSCLQSLTCQLFSGDENSNEDGINIKNLLQYSLTKNPPKQIVSAIKNGLSFQGNSRKCMEMYPFCMYSASTMLKLLRIFSDVFA